MSWAGHVARMVAKINVHTVLMVNHKGRWQRGRPRSKLEYNNRTFLRGLGAWTGQICFRIATGGKPFRRRWWTAWFHKMLDISWPAEELLVSPEWVCSMESERFLFTFSFEIKVCKKSLISLFKRLKVDSEWVACYTASHPSVLYIDNNTTMLLYAIPCLELYRLLLAYHLVSKDLGSIPVFALTPIQIFSVRFLYITAGTQTQYVIYRY